MILIDTSAILAVLDKNDLHHLRAAHFWEKLVKSGDEIFINSHLLIETTALIQRRYGVAVLRSFHLGMLPLFQVEWIDEEKYNEAMEILLFANRRHLSLVDVSAFATMRRLRITRVFTFDRHFAEQGFEVLP